MIGLVSFLSVTQYNCLIMKRKRVSAGAARCVAESEGLQVGKTGGPAGCDRCQAVGCYFGHAMQTFWSQQLTNKGSYQHKTVQCTETLKALKQAPVCTHHPPRNKKNIVKTWRVDAMTNDHDIQIHLLPLSPPVFPEADSASCRLGRGRAKWSYRTAR